MKRLNKEEWLKKFEEKSRVGMIAAVTLVRNRLSPIMELDYDAGLKEAHDLVETWKGFPKVVWEYVERGFYLESARVEMAWRNAHHECIWERIPNRGDSKATRNHAKDLIAYFNKDVDKYGDSKRHYRGLRFRAARKGKPDLVIKL